MTRVLLTGGMGMLGRELRPRLLAAGYTVRVMSQRAPQTGEDADVEWAQASLEKRTPYRLLLDGCCVANLLVM